MFWFAYCFTYEKEKNNSKQTEKLKRNPSRWGLSKQCIQAMEISNTSSGL